MDAVRTQLAANQAIFRSLGDITRQNILLLLAEADSSLTVGELARQTRLSRPAISHHLRILKEAGLLGEKKVGVRRYYYPTFSEAINGKRQLAKIIKKTKEMK